MIFHSSKHVGTINQSKDYLFVNWNVFGFFRIFLMFLMMLNLMIFNLSLLIGSISLHDEVTLLLKIFEL